MLSIIFGGIYTLDSPEYIHTASNLITHGISYAGNFTTDIPNPDLYSLRPPGYGFFIMMCSLFSENHYCILVIQNVLSIIVLYFIYKFIYDKIGSKDGLFWFWIGLVFFPVYFVLVNMVMADAVLGFILVMATFSFQFAPGSKSIGETRHDVFLDSESVVFSVSLLQTFFSENITYGIHFTFDCRIMEL